LYVLILSPSP
jgi:protocatechuate 3,4-dioxygenase beta subunit